MKTIGQKLKEARESKKFTFRYLSDVTKIKKEFLEALEQEKWDLLPEYPIVVGFVKNFAQAVDMDDAGAVALLRRDYPRKELRINPKPDVSKEFVWSPKLTFFTGIIVVALGVFAYLIYQYITFLQPPKLEVLTPTEGQVITARKVEVTGKTDSEATLVINNQPVLLDEDGNFKSEIEVVEGTPSIDVVSKSRSGKESRISRSIKVELNK